MCARKEDDDVRRKNIYVDTGSKEKSTKVQFTIGLLERH
jgi:hypothetical protein